MTRSHFDTHKSAQATNINELYLKTPLDRFYLFLNDCYYLNATLTTVYTLILPHKDLCQLKRWTERVRLSFTPLPFNIWSNKEHTKSSGLQNGLASRPVLSQGQIPNAWYVREALDKEHKIPQ